MKEYLRRIPLVAIIIISVSCFFLIYRAVRKYKSYMINPPFFALDYTRSHSLSREREVYHLIDGDYNSIWTEGQISDKEFDFEAELGLTHIPNAEGILEAKPLHEIRVFPCNGDADHAQLVVYNFSVFLREAIDIDQEKRLPKDELIGQDTQGLYSNGSHIRIPMGFKFKDVPESQFPKDINIITIKGKVEKKEGNGKACISEIILI
jgi:hypothetical protein